MTDLIWKGSQLIWVLLGCSIAAVGLFAERWLHFHRATLDVGDLLKGLAMLIKKRSVGEALQEAAATPGPVGRVVKAALVRHELPRTELKEIVQEAGQMEVPKLERHLPVLLAICYIAPLVGLLGTSLGLIDVFAELNRGNGLASTADLSRGVYSSLIITAAGLAVAIPCYVMYAYLVSRAKDLMHDMERAGIEIVHLLSDLRQAEETAAAQAKAAAVAVPATPALGEGQIIAFDAEARRRTR